MIVISLDTFSYITSGKIYQVTNQWSVDDEFTLYEIIDDSLNHGIYASHSFKNLELIRNEKLNNLGI